MDHFAPNVQRMTGVSKAAIAAACAMFLVGSQAAVLPTLAAYPFFGGQAIRYAVAGLILLAFASPANPTPRLSLKEIGLLIGLAASGLVGFNLFQVAAVREASPATVGTVLAALPIVLAVVGPLLVGRRPRRRVVIAAGIVTLGAALPSGLGATSPLGLLLALAVLACEVGFALFAVPLIRRLGAVRTSAYAALTATPMLVLAGVVIDGAGLLRSPTVGELLGFAYLSIVVTVVAFVLWYTALGRIGADRAGLFAGVVPIGAMVTGLLVGTNTPAAADLAGAALVICGVVVGVSASAGRTRLRTPAANPLAEQVVQAEAARTQRGEQDAADRDDEDQLEPVVCDEHAVAGVYEDQRAGHLRGDEQADDRHGQAQDERSAAEDFDERDDVCAQAR